MSRYLPKFANHLVYAVIGVNEKEGTKPKFLPVDRESFEEALNWLANQRPQPLKSAYPYPVGRYDSRGVFETYCPPIEGILPGRFVPHPLALEEYQQSRPY